MLSPPRKAKCPFSENGQFTLTLSTMHKMMKKSKKNIYFDMCGPSIKPEYRLELEKVNAAAVAKVVEEEFGPKFQRAGGKIVFGDNDKKLHSDV